MSSQDQDFSFLAHDLCQVLWAIQGRARALALELPPQAAREVAFIAEDAAAAAAMLSGEPEIAADLQTAVRDAWRQTIDRARAMARATDACRLLGPDQAARVAVPGHVLRRILGNLFANAVAAGCSVVTVVGKVLPTHEMMEIEVRDDGPGIAPELRPHLFSVEKSVSTSGGSGLGLPGSRSLARRWGGDLALGECEHGFCFVLTIPTIKDLHSTQESAIMGFHAEEATDGALVEGRDAWRILVVDDDPSVRGMLDHLLSALGHQPSLVGDFDEALALSATDRFDAALVDLRLAGRSGLELAMRLRDQDQALAVVLLTGWGREQALAEAPADCVDLTGVKPLDLPQLRRLIARAAQITKARRGGAEPED